MLNGKGSKTKRAKSHAEGPNSRVPHLVLPPELGNETIVPLLGRNQVIILHALIGFRKTSYHSNNGGPGLKVKSCISKGMTLVHVNDVVPCEP